MGLGSGYSYKKIFLSLIFEIAISASIIFISLRVYIMGNGFFDYADQYWGPTMSGAHLVSLYPTLNGGYIAVLGFTRSIITGIGTLLSFVGSTPVVQEKIFILYTFLIFFAFAFIFSEILYRLLHKFLGVNFGTLGKEALKTLVVIAVYCNIAIMNLNVDGGTWSDGLIILFMGISVAVSLLLKNKWEILSIVAPLLSISVLLDPDYFLAFVLVLFFVSLVNRQFSIRYRFFLPIAEVLISLPVVFYIIEGMAITSQGAPGTSFLAARSLFSIIPNLDQNPITAVLLIRHFWSTYSIGPPSILQFIGKNVFIPSYGSVILPISWITSIWLVTLSIYPLIALSALFFKPTRGIAIPFAVMWLVGFLMTIWWEVPVIRQVFVFLSNITFIGPAIATTISNPGHYMNVEAIAEVSLIAILIYNLSFNRSEIYGFFKRGGYILLSGFAVIFVLESWLAVNGMKGFSLAAMQFSDIFILVALSAVTILIYLITRAPIISFFKSVFLWRRAKTYAKTLLIIIIVFIVVFTGWQAFNGSFYPERSFNGSDQGLLTPDNGPFYPVNIPNYVVDTYSALTSSNPYSTIFFPTPSLPNNLPYVKGGYTILYLIDDNYISSIVPFLNIENIKYVVTYRDGPEIFNAFNETGMSREYLGPSSYLYINENALGSPYNANLLLNYSQSNDNYVLSYGPFESMNITPVFSNKGNYTFGFNNLSENVNMLTPQYFGKTFPTNEERIFLGSANGSTNVSLSRASQTSIGQGWYASDNSSATNISVGNRMLSLDLKNNTTISITYGSPYQNYQPLIPIANYENLSVNGTISFTYITSSNFIGNISLYFSYFYKNKVYASQLEGVSVPLSLTPSRNWKTETYSYAFPNNTISFTPYIVSSGISGEVSLMNISLSTSLRTQENSIVPSTSSVPMIDGSISLSGNGDYYLEIEGNGSLNGGMISSENGRWLNVTNGDLSVNGSLVLESAFYIRGTTLGHMKENFAVYDVPYFTESRMVANGSTYIPCETLGGDEFFATSVKSSGHLELLNLNFITYGFILISVFVILFPFSTLIMFPLYTKHKQTSKGKIKEQKN